MHRGLTIQVNPVYNRTIENRKRFMEKRDLSEIKKCADNLGLLVKSAVTCALLDYHLEWEDSSCTVYKADAAKPIANILIPPVSRVYPFDYMTVDAVLTKKLLDLSHDIRNQ